MTLDLATTLEREGPAISARVIAEMYAEPFWQERYGDAGRKPASEDGDFHVRYLVAALRAKSPATMVEYGRWLRTLLTSRGMCSRHLADNFARLGRALEGALGEAAKPAVAYLAAAEEGLLRPTGSARAIEDAAEAIAGRAITRACEPEEIAERRARRLDEARYVLSYLADGLAGGGEAALAGYLRVLARIHARLGDPEGARDRLLDAIDLELDAASAEAAASARALLGAARRAAETNS
jgi:hypothetical protein